MSACTCVRFAAATVQLGGNSLNLNKPSWIDQLRHVDRRRGWPMGTEMLEPGVSYCQSVVPGNHECGQLDDVSGFQTVRPQHSDDICEGLIRLLRHRGRRCAVRPNAELSGNEYELCPFRH